MRSRYSTRRLSAWFAPSLVQTSYGAQAVYSPVTHGFYLPGTTVVADRCVFVVASFKTFVGVNKMVMAKIPDASNGTAGAWMCRMDNNVTSILYHAITSGNGYAQKYAPRCTVYRAPQPASTRERGGSSWTAPCCS